MSLGGSNPNKLEQEGFIPGASGMRNPVASFSYTPKIGETDEVTAYIRLSAFYQWDGAPTSGSGYSIVGTPGERDAVVKFAAPTDPAKPDTIVFSLKTKLNLASISAEQKLQWREGTWNPNDGDRVFFFGKRDEYSDNAFADPDNLPALDEAAAYAPKFFLDDYWKGAARIMSKHFGYGPQVHANERLFSIDPDNKSWYRASMRLETNSSIQNDPYFLFEYGPMLVTWELRAPDGLKMQNVRSDYEATLSEDGKVFRLKQLEKEQWIRHQTWIQIVPTDEKVQQSKYYEPTDTLLAPGEKTFDVRVQIEGCWSQDMQPAGDSGTTMLGMHDIDVNEIATKHLGRESGHSPSVLIYTSTEDSWPFDRVSYSDLDGAFAQASPGVVETLAKTPFSIGHQTRKLGGSDSWIGSSQGSALALPHTDGAGVTLEVSFDAAMRTHSFSVFTNGPNTKDFDGELRYPPEIEAIEVSTNTGRKISVPVKAQETDVSRTVAVAPKLNDGEFILSVQVRYKKFDVWGKTGVGDVEVQLVPDAQPGTKYKINATLKDSSGKELTTGFAELRVKDAPCPVWETDHSYIYPAISNKPGEYVEYKPSSHTLTVTAPTGFNLGKTSIALGVSTAGQNYEFSDEITLYPALAESTWRLHVWRMSREGIVQAGSGTPAMEEVVLELPKVAQETTVNMRELPGWSADGKSHADDILVKSIYLESDDASLGKADDPQKLVTWTTTPLRENVIMSTMNATADLSDAGRAYPDYEKCSCDPSAGEDHRPSNNSLDQDVMMSDYIVPQEIGDTDTSFEVRVKDDSAPTLKQGQRAKVAFELRLLVYKSKNARWWSDGKEEVYLRLGRPDLIAPVPGTGVFEGRKDEESDIVTIGNSVYFKISNTNEPQYRPLSSDYRQYVTWEIEAEFLVNKWCPESEYDVLSSAALYFGDETMRGHTDDAGVTTVVTPYLYGSECNGARRGSYVISERNDTLKYDPLRLYPRTADNLFSARARAAHTSSFGKRPWTAKVLTDTNAGVVAESGNAVGQNSFAFSPDGKQATPSEEGSLAVGFGFMAGTAPQSNLEIVLELPRKGAIGLEGKVSTVTQLLAGEGVEVRRPGTTYNLLYSGDGKTYVNAGTWKQQHEADATAGKNIWHGVTHVKIAIGTLNAMNGVVVGLPVVTESSLNEVGSWEPGKTATSVAGVKAVSQTGVNASASAIFEYLPNEIRGNVWNDTNGNGMRDAGEAPARGAAMQLKGVGANDAYVTTRADGTYEIRTAAYKDLSVEHPLATGREVTKFSATTDNDFKASESGAVAVNARGIASPLTHDVNGLDLGLTGIGYVIDYIRETIRVSGGELASGTVRFFYKDGSPVTSPSGAAITGTVSNGVVSLTEVLDAAGVGPDGLIARFEEGAKTRDVPFPQRPKAPSLKVTPGYGAGSMGTVTVTDPLAGETYEYSHDAGASWQAGGLESQHRAGENVQARVSASAQPGHENFCGFAASEDMSHFRTVTWKVALRGADGATTELAPDQVKTIVGSVENEDTGMVTYGRDFLATVNNANKVPNGVYWQDSAAAPKFPAWATQQGGKLGEWETPGYDVVSVTAKEEGATGLRALLGMDEWTVIDGADKFYSDRDANARWNNSAANLEVTIVLAMREYAVDWDIAFGDQVDAADRVLLALDEAGKPVMVGGKELVVDGPSRQINIAWDDKVRTRLLSQGADEYWNPLDPAWVKDWFELTDATKIPAGDGVDHDRPVGPEMIGPKASDLMREPWGIRGNNGEFRTFQVAEALSSFSRVAPSQFMQKGGKDTPATSWRDADQVTFGVTYSKSEGAYALSFGVSDADYNEGKGYVNGNGAQYRTSLLAGENAFPYPTVRNVATNESLDAPGAFYNARTVLSAYLFDDVDKGTDYADPPVPGEPVEARGNAGPQAAQDITGRTWSLAGGASSVWDPSATVNANLDASWGALSGHPDNNPDDIQSFATRPAPDRDADNRDGMVAGSPPRIPATTAEVDAFSRAVLTARIENAALAGEIRLPLALEEGYANTAGTLDLRLAEPFTVTDASRSSYGKDKAPAFAVEAPTFQAAPSDPADWLAVALVDGKVALTVKPGLPVGLYAGTIRVPYSYTATTGESYQVAPVEFDITVTVSPRGGVDVDTQAGWALSAHDYATLRSKAEAELGSSGAIAHRTGLTLWSVSPEGAWSEVGSWNDAGAWNAVDGATGVAPVLTSAPSSLDGSANDVTPVVCTVDVNGTALAATPTVWLYDVGEPTLFLKDAATTLPELREQVEKGTVAYNDWLRALTGAIGYDPNDNWATLRPELDSDNGLAGATQEDVGKKFDTVWSLRGITPAVTATAKVELLRLPAPATQAPEQDYDNTTPTVLAWHEVESTIEGVKVEYGVFDGDETDLENAKPLYVVDAPVMKLFAKGLSQPDLEGNGKYLVAARVKESDTWLASPWAASQMWTRPTAPSADVDGVAFDYDQETINWAAVRSEGDSEVNVGVTHKDSTLNPGDSVSKLVGAKLDMLATGGGGPRLASQGELEVPARHETPKGLDAVASLDGDNGAIAGLTPGAAYQVVPEGGDWSKAESVKADDEGKIERAAGSWVLRVPASDGKFASLPTDPLAVKRDWTITYVTEDEARGTVTLDSEVVGEHAGEPKGSKAEAAKGWRFAGWVDADGNVVSTDPHFVPAAVDGAYATATYTATFVDASAPDPAPEPEPEPQPEPGPDPDPDPEPGPAPDPGPDTDPDAGGDGNGGDAGDGDGSGNGDDGGSGSGSDDEPGSGVKPDDGGKPNAGGKPGPGTDAGTVGDSDGSGQSHGSDADGSKRPILPGTGDGSMAFVAATAALGLLCLAVAAVVRKVTRV